MAVDYRLLPRFEVSWAVQKAVRERFAETTGIELALKPLLYGTDVVGRIAGERSASVPAEARLTNA